MLVNLQLSVHYLRLLKQAIFVPQKVAVILKGVAFFVGFWCTHYIIQ